MVGASGSSAFLASISIFTKTKRLEVTWANSDALSCVWDPATNLVFLVGGAFGNLESQTLIGGRDGFISALTPRGEKEFTRLWGGVGDEDLVGVAFSGRMLMLFGHTKSTTIDGQVAASGQDTDLVVVALCPAGQMHQTRGNNCSFTCVNVPAGYYRLFQDVAITQCPAGSYCPAATAKPIPCNPGSYCPLGSSSPQLCPAGSTCANPASAVGCANTTLCPAGSSYPLCPNSYSTTIGLIRVHTAVSSTKSVVAQLTYREGRIYVMSGNYNGNGAATSYGKVLGLVGDDDSFLLRLKCSN